MTRHALILLALISPLAVSAEKVDMTPDRLRATATHVVLAQVGRIYTRTEVDGDWNVTRYVAEIRVLGVEKGEGLAKNDLTYVRYWHRVWIGNGTVPPSTAGHRDLPAEGETLRIYLARNAYDGFGDHPGDGGFNVIGANGFEREVASDRPPGAPRPDPASP